MDYYGSFHRASSSGYVPLAFATLAQLPGGTQGTAYTTTVVAVGGQKPYTYSLASDTGANAWSVSASGAISGTPANAEADVLNITVTDSIGATLTEAFSVSVAASGGGGGGNYVQVFNYVAGSWPTNTISNGNFAVATGGLTAHSSNNHWAGFASYQTQQPPGSFTTSFTFQFGSLGNPASIGFEFIIQNTVSPPGQAGYSGYDFRGDANMNGWTGTDSQDTVYGAIAIKFDTSNMSAGNGLTPATINGNPSTTGLYFNFSPAIHGGSSLGMSPCDDITAGGSGIDYYSGHTFAVTLVYDGSLLTMTVTDQTTGAAVRRVWPLNLANTTNGTKNWIGFVAGTPQNEYVYINNWSYGSGYSTRLVTPTFSLPPGQYAGTQTVSIGYPAGSSCYYTVNGLLPTTASTLYTGPITVSANAFIQAIAVQSGYTDSLVGAAQYKIGTANTINFPSGFTTGSLIGAGYCYQSGTAYRLTDTNANTAGAVWFPAPVSIASGWSSSFQLQWGGGGQGLAFVIQNSAPAYAGLQNVQITGTGGQISFTPTSFPAKLPIYITISGTVTGTGLIAGYADPTIYYVSAVNGAAGTATLQTAGKTALTTFPGTTTGWLFSVNTGCTSGGPTVYGSGNNAMGYGGMDALNGNYTFPDGLQTSVALVFEQYALGSDPANSVGIWTNGASPNGTNTGQTSTGFTWSGGTYNCTLAYSGTTLSFTMQKSTGGTTFSKSWTVDIPGTVGGNTAYVGFTGGSGGGAHAVAQLNSWVQT